MRNMKFNYDSELNSLIIHKNVPAKGSINLGEIIIDVGKNNTVTAVEILNPDKILAIPKKVLSRISKAKIVTKYRGDLFFIFVILKIEDEKISRKMPIPLMMEKPVLAAT